MTPFDQYRQIRDEQLDWVLRHPFVNVYQPLEALRALTFPTYQSFVKSLVPRQTESGEAPLCEIESWPAGRFPNLAVSCQLALLWAALAVRFGDRSLATAAKRLAGFLSPIIEERLATLWTVEKDYREEETALSFDLLLRSMGKKYNAQRLASIEGEGLFSFFYQSDLQIELDRETGSDSHLGYQLFRKEAAAWALTSKGWQMPAGAIRMGDVEIPAFGPHVEPLSDPLKFGIGSEDPGDNKWFYSFAAKETWFRIEPILTDAQGISFVLHSVGVPLDTPIYFVFYVRADECIALGHVYKPKNLQRFSSKTDRVEWIARQTNITLTLDRPLKIEVIPLAGSVAYWGSTFLVAVHLSPFHSKTQFQFA